MIRRRIRAGVFTAALVLASGSMGVPPAGGVPAHAVGPAPALWVRAGGEKSAATLLHLQPGFATVLRFDHRVDTVAVGDPRLVTATAVRRGQDAYDLVLQPQAETGVTNMVVWYGEIVTVWTLEIGPGPRTADIVHVVTAGPASARPAAVGSPATRTTPAPAPTGAEPSIPPTSAAAPSSSSTPPTARAPAPTGTPLPDQTVVAAPPLLEVRQAIGEVAGVFQALKTPGGVLVKYRITNGGGADLVVRPGSVLVRVNGRLAPYGMARDSINRGQPEMLPRGATETGMIDVPSTAPRRVQLILSLFPSTAPDEAAGAALPLTFQPVFNGVDRLATTPNP